MIGVLLTHQDGGGAVEHGSVGDIGVAGDPADVGGTEVDIARLVVKGVLEGGGCVQHVAPHCVQYPLGLARAAAEGGDIRTHTQGYY